MFENKNNNQRIWAIGGGKGGVGKSLVTANLAICLSMLGNKVTAIDLDLGGANLHTCLGLPIPEATLSDYITGKVKDIKDLLTQTNIKNLYVISGAQDDLGIANLKDEHRNKFLSKVRNIDSDFLLFDLGAGTSSNTLDFFISAEKGILVVLPEPTSIENTYRFIKSVYYRHLKNVEELLDIGPLINQAMNSKVSGGSVTPADLVKKVIELNPIMGEKLKAEMAKFKLSLVLNQARSQADIDVGFSIQSICKRYFGIDIEYVGYLEYDASVWQSVKKRRPLITEFPNSRLVLNFDKMVHRLLGLK